MNWEAIAAIGEIIGLAIIVISLIFIIVQTREANDHATAASEISYIAGVDKFIHELTVDEQTFDVIRRGFSDFNNLKPYEKALFQAKVGVIVNHMILGKSLSSRNLLSKEIAEEIEKIAISIISTDGGLQYWEYDSKATPGGSEFLELARKAKGESPNWTDLIPWWKLPKS